eukprot:2834630-Rhodomonas_salina.1
MEIQAFGAVKCSPVLGSGKVQQSVLDCFRVLMRLSGICAEAGLAQPGEVSQVLENSNYLLVPLRSCFVDLSRAVVRHEVNPGRHQCVLRVAPAETLFLQQFVDGGFLIAVDQLVLAIPSVADSKVPLEVSFIRELVLDCLGMQAAAYFL